MSRIHAFVGGVALVFAAPLAAAESADIPAWAAADLRAAGAAAEAGDCVRAVAAADKARRASGFASLPDELRLAVVQIAGFCEGSLGQDAAAYRDLLAATELTDKRHEAAVATVEAMENGRGAALNAIPVAWFYEFDRRLKDAKDPALRRRLLAVLSQGSYDPDEAGIGNDGFRWRYAGLLYEAGEHEPALAIARQIESPSLVVNLSLDPRFRAAFPGDLHIRARVETRLAAMREIAATHPDQIGPVNDVATLLRVLGRPREALAALETIRGAIEGSAELSDRDEQVPWWWDQVSRAQSMLGDQPAALAALETGAAMKGNGGVNVSLTINLSSALLDSGRPADALATLRRLETSGASVSPCGTMQIVENRGCARSRLGSASDAGADLAAAETHASDAPDAQTRLLLCVGDLDGAARSVIRRLDTTDQRVEALRDLSTFDPRPTPRTDAVSIRFEALKARADVEAAAQRAGGTRRFEIQDVSF